jgi:hypothetical protein
MKQEVKRVWTLYLDESKACQTCVHHANCIALGWDDDDVDPTFKPRVSMRYKNGHYKVFCKDWEIPPCD